MVSSVSKARINRPRVLALDILRGAFLAVIAVDHFQRFPSIWDAFTGRGMLWVSAAEGFFIISGIVVGYIYGPKMMLSVKKTTFKIWRRALLLYGLAVGFTILFTAWGRFFIENPGIKSGISTDSWPSIVWHSVTLSYIYGWIDFLALYAVFMFVAPAMLYLIVRQKAWFVIILSVFVWALLRDGNPWLGWQIYFVPAIVVGYYFLPAEDKLAKLTKPHKKVLYSTLSTIVLIMLALSAFFVFVVPFIANRPSMLLSMPEMWQETLRTLHSWYIAWLEPHFYKWTIPLPRVLFAWVWFITLLVVVRHFEKTILTYTKDFFTVLGRNSLFTYCFMGVLIFALHFIFVPRITRFNLKDLLINTVTTGLLLALLYVAAKYKDHWLRRAKAKVLQPKIR